MQCRLLSFFLLWIFAAGIFNSCSNTRYLTGDQILYTGRKKVAILGQHKIRNQKAADQLIHSVTFYKPNNSIAGKRLLPPAGLWIHNYLKPKGKGKLSNWFYKKFSAEPVLVSQVNTEIRCQKVKSELFNIGFFRSAVWAEIDTSPRNPRKAKINYFVRLDPPFTYNNVSFASPVDDLDSIIYNYRKDFKIRTNDVFNLEAVKSEAKKITGQANEKGYFFFNSNQLIWAADTTITPYRIDLKIKKNNKIPWADKQKYDVRKITIRVINPVDSVHTSGSADTIQYDGVSIIASSVVLKPAILARSIYFRSGDLYSSAKHQQTLQRLNSFGVFKFINMQFLPGKDTLDRHLDLMIDLTPVKSISLDLEANVVSKSTGFSGPGFAASLVHGNLARGANKLQLRLNGGFEWQLGKTSSSTLGTTSYNLGISSSVVFPRILLPQANLSRYNLSRTSINAGFEFLNKIQYYRMSSLNLGLAYQLRKSEKITHIYYPLYFNLITLLKTTSEFDSVLNGNPYIRRSFEEQFIAGMKYEFIYDNSSQKQRNGFYFQGGFSAAGNTLDLIRASSSKETSRPYKIAGNVYSQFVKLSSDLRYYRNARQHSLVFRLYAGVGIPYSNSIVMPYVEQFYSGGANSVRAFFARSLGPGKYPADKNSGIIDQTGDIKLEGNVEYRFKMTRILHGALFVDLGNVWLLNKDENRPGAEFNFSNFQDQLAVGTGVGLRFDFNFFILRTDLGLPLRRPYQINGNNWITPTRDVFSGYVFNLAIGYPF